MHFLFILINLILCYYQHLSVAETVILLLWSLPSIGCRDGLCCSVANYSVLISRHIFFSLPRNDDGIVVRVIGEVASSTQYERRSPGIERERH